MKGELQSSITPSEAGGGVDQRWQTERKHGISWDLGHGRKYLNLPELLVMPKSHAHILGFTGVHGAGLGFLGPRSRTTGPLQPDTRTWKMIGGKCVNGQTLHPQLYSDS